MKNRSLLLFGVLGFVSSIKVTAQSFEEMNFSDITTTPSGSRSANFIDVNGDGWDDIFISNGPSGGQNNMLYINNSDGTFTTITSDDIVLDGSSSDGTSFADVDNDGDLDAFVVTWASGAAGKNFFYRNNGNGTFSYEPNIAMGSVFTFSEMATWIDVNNDQLLDLYFTNSNGILANSYYENLGNGDFQNNNVLSITSESKATRNVDWVDYDGDGDFDLFLTNENNTPNSLFRNDGPDNFTPITNLSIVQDSKNSAGSSWEDIDNDGDFDLFVANWGNQNNQLFINEGGTFSEQTTSIIASGGGNSFGSSFGDMDNDGDLDLFVCNAFAANQTNNFVYLNDGQGNFTQDTSSVLATHTGWTFGCAFGDYDNDGWLDLILANTFNESQTNSVFHNTGSGNNWVKINCIGTTSNKSAVGAIVKAHAVINGNSVWQTRKIVASTGYCSQNSYTIHFGLGDAALITDVEITWPSGLVETFTDLDANNIYRAEEGSGITLGISNFNKLNDLKVYPNPLRDTLFIESNFLSNHTDLKLVIFNVNGEIIKEYTDVNPSAAPKIMVRLPHLTTGVYIYTLLTNNEKLVSGKLIKE